MLNFPLGKIYNSYLIETNDYLSTKKDILDFAVLIGFEKNLVFAGTHPDISCIEVVDEKIKISDIKSILEESFYAPKVSDKKFYIVYDAVNLDEDDQSAMLKTLEEPPEFDTFFLVTSNASKIFDTIKSRCFYLRNEINNDYKKILSIEFIDDALKILEDLKYESETELMLFADKFDKREDMFHDLVNIYRFVLRDALVYKKTLSKELINSKEKEVDIISIANTFTYEEFGYFIDELDKLAILKGIQVDKRIAIFNYLRGINGKVFRNKI